MNDTDSRPPTPCGQNHSYAMLNRYSNEGNGFYCREDSCRFAYQSMPRNDKNIIRG